MDKILYFIVIYKIKREQSRAWQQLHALLGKDKENCIYVHDNTENNIYLAAAYNKGWQYAKQNGYSWIVLLDADTNVTKQFIDSVQEAVNTSRSETVFCPELIDDKGTLLSPLKSHGIDVAFNSGLVVPIHIIDKLNGYNENYPLDYLDYWFCYQLHQLRIPLEVLAVRLTHSLSVCDYSQVSKERYLSLLAAEKRFAKETGHERLYRIRLFCRLIKWILTGHKYIRETYCALIENK